MTKKGRDTGQMITRVVPVRNEDNVTKAKNRKRKLRISRAVTNVCEQKRTTEKSDFRICIISINQ